MFIVENNVVFIYYHINEVITMSKRKSQIAKLLSRLSTGENLTVAEARNKLGVTSVFQRIHDLRDQGFDIYTNKVRVKTGPNRGKRVTAYRLVG